MIVWLLSRIGDSVGSRKDVSPDQTLTREPTDESKTTRHESESVDTINVQTKDIMSNNEYDGMDTPTLMRTLLKMLNCKCQENDDGTLYFSYQGESFWLSTGKDTAWVRIIDLQWYDCPLDNLEEVSCMQKAINTANVHQISTAVYSIDKENNKLSVYSKLDFALPNDFPEPEAYLSALLAQFFHLKQAVALEFEKEKQKLENAD